MMRGNNRQMRRMMDRMGVDIEEIPNVQEVLIITDKKEMVITKPTVSEMKSGDGSTFMINAQDYEERERDVQVFSDDEIEIVCVQAGVDKERAEAALRESDGDLAQAILMLKNSG